MKESGSNLRKSAKSADDETFSSDPRLLALSPQARDLLERILEVFPHDDLFGSGVPAAPAQLRLTCYRSDDPRPDCDIYCEIGRQLIELELTGIIILRRDTRKTRRLTLTLDFCGAPERSCNKPMNRGVVINNSCGLSPPDLLKIAAAAADPSDFCTRARAYFPQINVEQEWNDYVKRCPGRATLEIFATKVLPRAQRRFGPIEKPKANMSALPERYRPGKAQLDLFTETDFAARPDEHEHQRFLRQYRMRKERKQA